MPSHEPDGPGKVGWGAGGLDERGDHVEVQGAGVDLSDRVQGPVEAQTFGNQALQVLYLPGVPVEEVQLVLLSADRPLEPPKGVVLFQVGDSPVGDQEFLGRRDEPLPQGGGLGHHIVGPAGNHQRRILGRQAGQPGQGGHHPVQDYLETVPDLELFDIFGEVPRRHSLVDLFMASQGAEFLQPGLHVVTGGLLPSPDGSQVNLVDYRPIVGDHRIVDFEAEVPLGFEHGDP